MRTAVSALLVSLLVSLPLGHVARADNDRPPLAPPAPPAPAASPTRPADPKGEFERHALGFEDWVAYNVHTGVVVNAWSVPVEGKYRRRLDYGQFYEKVGRADLANQYRTRRTTKIALIVAGGAVFIAGFAAIMGQFAANESARSDCLRREIGDFGASAEACDATGGNGAFIAGGVLMGGGFITALAGLIHKQQPVEPYVARELADQYNQRLQHDLGLDVPPPPPAAPAPAATPAPAPAIEYTLLPSASRNGAGLLLSARF